MKISSPRPPPSSRTTLTQLCAIAVPQPQVAADYAGFAAVRNEARGEFARHCILRPGAGRDPPPDAGVALTAEAAGAGFVARPRPDRPSERQRVGAELEVVDLGPSALAAFHVERRAAAGGGPDPLALPAGPGIVDPPVHALDVEAERIGHAQGHELAVDQRQEPFGAVAGGDRHIGAETQRVELIDPGVIARLGAAGARVILQFRSGERVERPALGALPADRLRPVQRALTFLAVEAGEMAARQRHPHDALLVDVHTARRIAMHLRLRVVPRWLVEFGQRGFRRVGARDQVNNAARKAERRPPDRPVGRADRDAVEPGDDALVLLRIDRLVGLDIVVALAVAVGVEDEGGPALRGGGVA